MKKGEARTNTSEHVYAEAAKAFNEMSKKLYGAEGKQNKLD